MFGIIKRPVFTDKATRLLEIDRQYTFDVEPSLTKPKIRVLIEKRFSVQVRTINTHRNPRKKRRGRISGCFLPRSKRVIITLTNGAIFPRIFNWFLFFMGLRYLRPTSPGTRNAVLDSFKMITCQNPEKTLLQYNHRARGRNHRGVRTCRRRGGGHKRLYRTVDILRKNVEVVGYIRTVEYDPNRNAHIALVQYTEGGKAYILAPKSLQIGQSIMASFRAPIEIGNALPLWNVPLGVTIHNVEFRPGEGGRIARSAGTSVQLIARDNGFATLRLPSGEVRLVPQTCWATIGQVGNLEVGKTKIGKAGRIRWLGWRPTVRGSVINPIDHPHGGGEGRCPIGRDRPSTPWGKPRLGVKTRRRKKYSDRLILRRKRC
jgi:large subunit ribosomal protein L2